MKVLTIRQPWASLIINGYKKYEFRSWKTNYSGKLLIHAALGTDKKLISRFDGYNLDYTNGAIIGECDLVDCIFVDKEFSDELRMIDSNVYANSNYTEKYAWKLENIIKYDEPIYCKGQLGLWNYDK